MDAGKELKLKITDSELRGVYANHIGIMHTKSEFVIDFISMLPPEPIVNSRVITTPTAIKRIYEAIGLNIKKYEDRFGEIISEETDGGEVNERVN